MHRSETIATRSLRYRHLFQRLGTLGVGAHNTAGCDESRRPSVDQTSNCCSASCTNMSVYFLHYQLQNHFRFCNSTSRSTSDTGKYRPIHRKRCS